MVLLELEVTPQQKENVMLYIKKQLLILLMFLGASSSVRTDISLPSLSQKTKFEL